MVSEKQGRNTLLWMCTRWEGGGWWSEGKRGLGKRKNGVNVRGGKKKKRRSKERWKEVCVGMCVGMCVCEREEANRWGNLCTMAHL